MSLFKAREWWTTKCGSEELFDYGLLAVGNVDNSESGCGEFFFHFWGVAQYPSTVCRAIQC